MHERAATGAGPAVEMAYQPAPAGIAGQFAPGVNSVAPAYSAVPTQ